MDEQIAADTPSQSADTDPAVVEQTSAEYLGRWNRLVSATNWEKGRIISAWRTRLMDTGAPAQAYSDEAWSRRVGNVSPQHVGRLRRVFDQFGHVCEQYPGLYWSHFQAALDWHDAEMWLEGAVQNGWSVAQMRATRWEAMGAPADKKPKPEDIVASELDEDVDPAVDESPPQAPGQSMGVVEDLHAEHSGETDAADGSSGESGPPAEEATAFEPVRPFEDLPPMPDDLAEAFEAFKLAILNHKLSGWQEISCGQVLATLDALKQLALAPSDA